MTAIGVGVTTIIVGEIRISATTRSGTQAFYAAEAGVERSLQVVKQFRQDPNACLASGCANPTVSVIQGFTAGSVDPLASNATYDASGTQAVSESVTANVEKDGLVQVDLFDADDSLGPVGVCSMKVVWQGGDSEWAEVSWTGWRQDGTLSQKPKSKFFSHTDLVNNLTTVDLPLDDIQDCTHVDGAAAAGFRVRVRALYDSMQNLTVTAYSELGGGGTKKEIPARVRVKSVGGVNDVKQAVIADLPWKIPLGGLFDYVLYSEETLAKDIATGTPIYSSGVIQVEDALGTTGNPFPDNNSCVGCSPGNGVCEPSNLSESCKDCGWKASACTTKPGATTCSTDGTTGSCRIGYCETSSWKIPIPDSVPAGAEYYLSVKAHYGPLNLGGQHMTVAVTNPGFSDQTLNLYDQYWNNTTGGPDKICTINNSFELKPVSGRTLTFTEGPPYQSTAVDVDWYQVSTFKLFGDCLDDAARIATTGNASCQVCGNGIKEGSEDCDTLDFGVQTCASRGFNNGGVCIGGTNNGNACSLQADCPGGSCGLACRPPGAGGCTIDDAKCFNCPDATCETGETCAGDDSSCPNGYPPTQCKVGKCQNGCQLADISEGSADSCTLGTQYCCNKPSNNPPWICQVPSSQVDSLGRKGCINSTECNDSNACTTDTCNTGTNVCQNYCTNATISACTPGDGCCPGGCANPPDTDCTPPVTFNDNYLRDRPVDEDGTLLSSLPGSGKSLRTTAAWNPSFQFVNPNPSTQLFDVFGIDRNNIWAVGNNDSIYHFNGSGWSQQSPPGSGKRYSGVWAADGNTAWAAGGNQADNLGATIIKTTNGGSTWTSETLPGGVTGRLLGIYGINGSNIWAVGFGGTVLYYNGSSWIQLTSPDVTQQLNDIWAANASNVWVVSDAGQIRKCTTSPCTTAPTTWSANQVVANACLSATTHRVEGITGIDATHVWASGRNSLSTNGVIMYYNGTNWCDAAASGGIVTNTTTAVHDIFTNDTAYSAGNVDIWAVGQGGATFYSKGVVNNSWLTTWAGSSSCSGPYQANGKCAPLVAVDQFYQYGLWADRSGGTTANVWTVGLDSATNVGKVLFGDAPGGDRQVQLGVDQRWYSAIYPTSGKRGDLTIPTGTYRGLINVTQASISGGSSKVNFELSFGVCRDGSDADTTLCNNLADEFTTVGTSAIIQYGSTVATGPHLESICAGCPAAPVTCNAVSPCRIWFRVREPGTSTAAKYFMMNQSGFDTTTSGSTIDQSWLDKL